MRPCRGHGVALRPCGSLRCRCHERRSARHPDRGPEAPAASLRTQDPDRPRRGPRGCWPARWRRLKVYVDSVGTPDDAGVSGVHDHLLLRRQDRAGARWVGPTATMLPAEQLAESVKQAAVAARDPEFWTSSTSAITRDVTRAIFDLPTTACGPRQRSPCWPTDSTMRSRRKRSCAGTSTPWLRSQHVRHRGRGNEYFGKTARTTAPPAEQVTTAEAIALVAMLAQPNPTPDASRASTRAPGGGEGQRRAAVRRDPR